MSGHQPPLHPTNPLNQRLDVDFALQAAGLGVWELDPITQQIKWDNRCQQLFGLGKESQLPYQEAIHYIHPQDQQRVDQAVQRALNPESDGQYDVTYRTIGANDGQLRWVRFMGKSYFHPDGQVYRFAGVAQEVTQQMLDQQVLEQARARQTFLLMLSDHLRGLSDASQIQYQAACLLGEYLTANRVGYAETQSDKAFVAVTRNYTKDVVGIEGLYRYTDYGPELLESLQSGKTVIRPDIARDVTLTDTEKKAHAVLQLGATLNLPLVKERQLVAILFVHYQEPHAFSEHEVSLVQETAERIWAAVERARAEEALRESEQRFRQLADALPQAIWVTDPQGNVEFLNKWWADYSGIPFEPTTAWQVATDSLHPEDGPRLVATFQQAIQQGKGFAIEQRNRSASGKYRWFLNVGEPYRDQKTGQITKWVGMSLDIDERKRAQQALADSENRYRSLAADLEQRVEERTQALQQVNQDLMRSNANLQQFAYVASHDLQEPLRKIQAFSTLLNQEAGNLNLDKQRDYLNRISSASARMSNLIRDLLNYSRIATRQEAFGSISLANVVAGVLENLSLVIEGRQAQIRVDELPQVKGDGSQLGQLVENLVSNALKFTPQDRRPQIHLQYKKRAASELPVDVHPGKAASFYHQISVSDQGIGFDPKYVDRIFQVFQRLHGKQEFPGTGIGLAICLRVVENHGGAITAHSRPGEGATFYVYLPV